MAVKKVKAWMSSDGSVFGEKEDAENREKEISKKLSVQHFVDKKIAYAAKSGLSEEELKDILLEFCDYLEEN